MTDLIAKLKELHCSQYSRSLDEDGNPEEYCEACGKEYPCPTINLVAENTVWSTNPIAFTDCDPGIRRYVNNQGQECDKDGVPLAKKWAKAGTIKYGDFSISQEDLEGQKPSIVQEIQSKAMQSYLDEEDRKLDKIISQKSCPWCGRSSNAFGFDKHGLCPFCAKAKKTAKEKLCQYLGGCGELAVSGSVYCPDHQGAFVITSKATGCITVNGEEAVLCKCGCGYVISAGEGYAPGKMRESEKFMPEPEVRFCTCKHSSLLHERGTGQCLYENDRLNPVSPCPCKEFVDEEGFWDTKNVEKEESRVSKIKTKSMITFTAAQGFTVEELSNFVEAVTRDGEGWSSPVTLSFIPTKGLGGRVFQSDEGEFTFTVEVDSDE